MEIFGRSIVKTKDAKTLVNHAELQNIEKYLINSSDDLVLHDLEIISSLKHTDSKENTELLKTSLIEHAENFMIESKMNSLSKVVLNVGGEKHEILWKNLDNIPNSRLGKLKKAFKNDCARALEYCDGYDEKNNEFFFDKSSRSFLTIIEYHRTGKLHFLEHICVRSFQDDLNYWGINEFSLDECCIHRYNGKKQHIIEEMNKNDEILGDELVDNFVNCCPNIRRKIWNTLENQDNSVLSRVCNRFIMSS
jgi:hypothetical protein